MKNSTRHKQSTQRSRSGPTDIRFRIGRYAHRVSVADFTDAACTEIAGKLTEGRSTFHIDLTGLTALPGELRWRLLGLIRLAGDRAIAKVGRRSFDHPFDAVLASITGADDLNAHRNALRAAIEAAAIFHADIAEAAADRIAKRLNELGYKAPRRDTLAKSIRILAHQNLAVGADRDGPLAMAGSYLQELRETAGLKGDSPVLLYYRSSYWRWLSPRWQPVKEDQLKGEITQSILRSGVAEVSAKLLVDLLTNLRGMVLHQRWDVEMPMRYTPNQVIERPMCLACQNGVLDFEHLDAPELALSPTTPNYFTACSIPVDYDPGAQCPRWLAFLNQALPRTSEDDRRQEVLQQFFGYSLLPECRYEAMLILYGAGRTGKSTVLTVWERMLGSENVARVLFEQIGNNFRLVDLQNKYVNLSSEIDFMGKGREGLLKQIISGEPITSDRKHKDSVKLRLFVKLVFACNDLPNISDTSEGMWRRLLIIPFENPVPKEQVNIMLADELSAEAPGILSWALAGLQQLREQGHFSECGKGAAAIGEHRTTSDTVAEFLEECCRSLEGWAVHSQRLYELYVAFCEGRGRKPVGESEFGKRLTRHGSAKCRATPTQDEHRPDLYQKLHLSLGAAYWMERAFERPTQLNYRMAPDSEQPASTDAQPAAAGGEPSGSPADEGFLAPDGRRPAEDDFRDPDGARPDEAEA
ncbi:MAG: DUF5906 domain-containing protein [Planctomycetia bacterium]|nr:DUF5906 domain-containing protein [Planctomycetia bacterium]